MKNLLNNKKVLIGIGIVLLLAIGYFYYIYSSTEGNFSAGTCSASTVGECCSARRTCVASETNNTTAYRCEKLPGSCGATSNL